MREDEDAWWDALAGNPPPDAEESLKREAAALRGAALRRLAAPAPEVDIEAALARLHHALRRDSTEEPVGIVPQDRPSSNGGLAGWLRSRTAHRWAMAAVLVLAVGLGIEAWIQSNDEIQSRRGAVDRSINAGERSYVRTIDPVRQQQELAAALKALGIEAQVFTDSSGAQVVQAALPAQVDGKLRETLDQHGLSAVTGGDLDVGFRTP